ncbi:MAG: pyridoxamine 5'-phosphate oxidase family protein [Erysipelotrichaceae bacterium]|jgi:uncharacterized pyridoxamine 5'-phosphate oxidase family protein|nr:pyridoxamine 5'-phosphate oxidase family protein [Erysipelotrichaceae bacterium]
MDEVLAYLKKIGTYYLATSEGDQPRVRPFGTATVFEGKLYIQTGANKPVFQQILKNPKIEICGYDGESWLRIEAEAVDDSRMEAKEALFAEYPELLSLYDIHDDNTKVLYLKNATASFCTYTAAPRIVKF